MTLVSEDEAEPIHSAIARKEAWTQDSVRRLRADADRRMKDGPWTVTSDRPKGVAFDIHDYYSEAPYWWPVPEDPKAPYVRRDGQMNPNRFLANKTALNAMSDTVFSLGTAAFMLDNPQYAQRATRVIYTWFINPKTRMNPSLEYAQAIPNVNQGRGAGIVDGRVLIRAIQGMEFLSQTGAWDPKEQAAVRKWFEEYLRWLTQSTNGADEKNSGNNHSSWWTAQVAAVATFVEDDKSQQMAYKYYSERFSPARSSPMAALRLRRPAPGLFPIPLSIWKHSPPFAASRRCTTSTFGRCKARATSRSTPSSTTWYPISPTRRNGAKIRSPTSRTTACISWPSRAWV